MAPDDAATVLAAIKGLTQYDEGMRAVARRLLLAGEEKGWLWEVAVASIVKLSGDWYPDELERLAWIGLRIRNLYLNNQDSTEEATAALRTDSVLAYFIRSAIEAAAELNTTEEGRLVSIGWQVSRLEYWTRPGVEEN